MGNRPDADVTPDPAAPTEVAPLVGAAAQLRHTSVSEELPRVAGRYELLGMLGAGGMGTVYRARDVELDEVVALKVLKKELTGAPGMLERFRREVKLSRRVTHKNVARMFDIGEHGGDRFLTMELVEGEMLGAHLARRGRLSVRDVVAIGRDVCAGLAAAHDAGILHRDLKPENVIVAKERGAVITDFGIARAVAEGELARTVAGAMVGTPAYMAPEQVEGAADLDARADLYALGAMLFELLTGREAWTGDSVIAIAAARLLRPPPDPRTLRSDLSEEASALVMRLMARQRDDRHATAREVAEHLERLASEEPSGRSLTPAAGPAALEAAGGPAARCQKSVAILPLLNMGALDDEYLAQTLTEDLVDLLSVVPGLRVRPRGETSRWAHADRDVREAGRSLGVDVVVEGSLRRIEDSVRVSVRLVTVEDGFQLWARRFERAAAQVLTIADEAASAVAHALATKAVTNVRAPVVDEIAQDLYLRGRYLLYRMWFEVSRDALGMLREAHERAPEDLRIAGTYALARARLSLATTARSASETQETLGLAESVLARSPMQAEARLALGILALNGGESSVAATHLRRALDASPNSVEALDAAGRVLVEIGHGEIGAELLRRALAIDPNMVHARHALARASALDGDFDAFHAMLGPPPEHEGDLLGQLFLCGRIALWRGDAAEAARLREVARPYARGGAWTNLDELLGVGITRYLDVETVKRMEAAMPLNGAVVPRRASFFAQVRTELKLATGHVESGLQDLRAADANGLLDLDWLDRCPLFGEVRRTSAVFAEVRESTARRAARVVEILVPARR